MSKIILLALVFIVLIMTLIIKKSTTETNFTSAYNIIGQWRSQAGDSKIEIYSKGNTFSGK